MKEILILSINRMGDLLQLTPVMAGLKRKYPQVRLTAVVEKNFAETCKGIPFIDEFFSIELSEYARKLVNKDTSIVSIINSLKEFIKTVNQQEYDLVINLTFSRYSAYLTSLIRAKEIRGISIDKEGHHLPKHKWVQQFFNSVINREINPFNVVDFHLKTAQLSSEDKKLIYYPNQEDFQWVDSFFVQEGVKPGEKLIAIQIGASREHKRWKLQKFAELADKIHEELGMKILLLGSKWEEGIGKEISSQAKHPLINAIGKTTISQATVLLKKCELLICNDSGPMHLATTVETKVLLISLGAANYQETGPYGKGHLIIHSNLSCFPCDFTANCPHMLCTEKISTTHVFEATKLALGKEVTNKEKVFWEGVSLLRTDFDEEGMLEYVPIFPIMLTKKAFYLSFYRFFWQCEDKENGFNDFSNKKNMVTRLKKKIRNNYYLSNGKKCFSFKEDKNALFELKNISLKGVELCTFLLAEANKTPPNVENIKRLGLSLHLFKNKIAGIGMLHSFLKPVTAMFDFKNSHLEGEGLEFLTQQTLKFYKELALQIDIILKSINEVFPEEILSVSAKENKSLPTGKVKGEKNKVLIAV